MRLRGHPLTILILIAVDPFLPCFSKIIVNRKIDMVLRWVQKGSRRQAQGGFLHHLAVQFYRCDFTLGKGRRQSNIMAVESIL
jgi:hypothetical protein